MYISSATPLQSCPGREVDDLAAGQAPAPRPTAAYFELHESYEGEWVRLALTGDLDLGSAPALRDRLAQLLAERRPVRLDLSNLEFMDSTGIHLLIDAFNDAREAGCQLTTDSELPPQVRRILDLVGVDLIGLEHMIRPAA